MPETCGANDVPHGRLTLSIVTERSGNQRPMSESSVKSTQPAENVPIDAAIAARPLAGEHAVVWTLWLTYGVFYFCRNNLSVAAPGMKMSIEEGGLGLSAAEVGWILASL